MRICFQALFGILDINSVMFSFMKSLLKLIFFLHTCRNSQLRNHKLILNISCYFLQKNLHQITLCSLTSLCNFEKTLYNHISFLGPEVFLIEFPTFVRFTFVAREQRWPLEGFYRSFLLKRDRLYFEIVECNIALFSLLHVFFAIIRLN